MNDQDDIAGLFKEAVEGFEALLEDVKKEHPPAMPLAWRAGCDHCCASLPEITVTAVEAFHLTEFITENFETAAIDTLIETLAGADKAAPFPLLQDGRRSV